HIGMSQNIALSDSCYITVDNLLHGLLFDVMELYGVRLSKMPEKPSPWTATILLGFRLTYDALAVYMIYLIYQRYRIGKLDERLPGIADWRRFVDWIDALCRDEENWGRLLHDEMIFQAICEEYVRGNFEVVGIMASQFVNIEVSQNVREIFVHPATGKALYE